ncbi:MAG TPA: SOS response-associated peptidase [Candidatus Dormibacteraeota bacterium]|nr:SOS response-associated peptidase [Candidatus Dormibacteraeota bacterium]
MEQVGPEVDNSSVCGRIGYTLTPSQLVTAYPWVRDSPDIAPRYNIAPTDLVVAIDREKADLIAWGLEGPRGSIFNLRRETALSRSPYRSLLLANRAVVPASHFYEWRRVGSRRLPVAIFRSDGAPLSLAGVIGRRNGAPAVTILTTTPNPDLEALHDRMPVVLTDEDARAWALEKLSLERLTAMMAPCPEGFLELRPASPLVNDVHNDGPNLLNPDALPSTYQLDLLDH